MLFLAPDFLEIMTAHDPANSIQHYPMPMERFGVNPFGENRFRIVMASSRRSLVHGKWNESGAARAKYCLTYPQMGHEWILEEWLDAFIFTGGVTAHQWNADASLNILGPYPSRGEYQMCGNCGFDPAQTNIEKLISLVHGADRYSWAEKLAACRESAARDELSRAETCRAIILDSFPAFGHAPFSQLSTGRGGAAKTSPVLRSANELGLPVPQGKPGEVTTGGAMVVPKKKRRKAA